LKVYNAQPYILYQTSIPGYLSIATYTGGVWTNYTPVNFSSRAAAPAFGFATNGVIYVGYSDATNSGKLEMMQYSNSVWSSMGVVSTYQVDDINVFVSTNNLLGVSYVEQGQVKVKVWK
jgi:hypothetical protein